ncbi:FAD:protein FMN transferase [Limosilactobacillus difficilis]|uniref:FAD:protein FMN transferase n=1 Tax=Limosilactobacillus difficilis TaxID=2991838 RepID=UPI0024BA8F56|nr:FAD:protein FMN transferase [Limosilactobacillus difficilis]
MIPNLAQHTVSLTGHALGTRIVLTAFGTTDRALLQRTLQLIDHYEDLLTVNRNHSMVMSVNQAAGNHPVQLTPMVYTLVKRAVEVSRQRFGFNALIGPLVKAWRIGFKGAHVPTDEQIAAKLRLTDPDEVELNDQDQTVYLRQTGMEIDLGGIAKGYIADRIRDYWRSAGLQSGIINLGGNLLFVGPSPRRQDGHWVIGIQDPRKVRGRDLQQVVMPECSAVTSGTYERVLVQNGHRYHHLLDPQTGRPRRTSLSSVTVFARDSITAEIETKRLFFAGQPLVGWGQRRPDIYGAFFIDENDQTKLVRLPTNRD